MAQRERHRGRAFHEWPLVLFTALATAGGGIGVVSLIRGLLTASTPAISLDERLLVGVLLVGGAVLSARHLGKPVRGPLAFRGVGRSPLSGEVLALALTSTCAFLGTFAIGYPRIQVVLDILVGAGSVTLLLTVGAVYQLPGQLSWRGPVAFQPLLLGTAWGLIRAVGLDGPGPELGLLPAAGAVLVADGLLVCYRWMRLNDRSTQGEVGYPGPFRRRTLLLGGRLVLSALVSPALVLAGVPSLALLAFSLALLMDRYAFYALAVRQTTESEVERVEAFLG